MLIPAAVWGEETLDAKVKAAYLYNFLLFVEWPTPANSAPMRVCTLGQGAIKHALAPIVEHTAAGQSIVLEHLEHAAGAANCHLLFIAEARESRLRDILRVLRGLPVLTVSNIADFARRGGMIGFVSSERRVRLEINLLQARKAGLRISSKLLEVAIKVYAKEASEL